MNADIPVSALDRRLQVDRVLALDPLSPIADDRPPLRAVPAASGRPEGPAGSSAAPAASLAGVAGLVARVGLGEVVNAEVLELPSTNHVIARIDDLRVAMDWPASSDDLPVLGQTIALRLLAYRPLLLFQTVRGDGADAATRPDDGATQWSENALRLQAAGSASAPGAGPLRFDVPILELEVVPVDDTVDDPSFEVAHARLATRRDAPLDRLGGSNPRTALATTSFDPSALSRVALGDVIVAHATAMIDGAEAPSIPRAPQDATTLLPTIPFVPLVLQGPAWPGQTLDLLIRREREDEQLDNPALDRWCGEVVMDLPKLGRVAGHLSFSMQGLKVRLEGDDEDAVSAMADATAELAAAFAGADLRIAGLSVTRPSADATRPDPMPPTSTRARR